MIQDLMKICALLQILDYTGSSFHSDWTDGSVRKLLGLNELVHNYINERVVELFHDVCFVEAQEVSGISSLPWTC